jgi:hypothetical protein
MSKKILEDIKALPQNERIELYRKLQDMIAYDNNQFSQGRDPGTGFHDDYVTKAYAGDGKNKAAATTEKVKTGEVLPGPITEEDVKTGEADKIKKED